MLNPEFNEYKGLKVIRGYSRLSPTTRGTATPSPSLFLWVLLFYVLDRRFHQHSTITIYYKTLYIGVFKIKKTLKDYLGNRIS